MVFPADKMSSGSKVIIACISRMVAYVSAWYMLSLDLAENKHTQKRIYLFIVWQQSEMTQRMKQQTPETKRWTDKHTYWTEAKFKKYKEV